MSNSSDNFSRRLLDTCVSIIGLFLLSPLSLIIAMMIKRESRGPVFYHSLRVGKHGREFRMLKFRTMNELSPDSPGPRVTARNDPRITPLGRWLRHRKLNEMPQLWNVLKGDMSLVGPRPEDPAIVATWPADIRQEVLSVRPGITSPATILYRHEEELLSQDRVMEIYLKSILPDKLRLDQLYVHHRSWLLDLDILLWTPLFLLPSLKRFTPSEDLIFSGPITRFARRGLKLRNQIQTPITLK